MSRKVSTVAAGILGHHNQFLHAAVCQQPGFIQHIIQLTAAVLAPKIGNDAVCAPVIAAFRNFNERIVLRSGDDTSGFLLRCINGAKFRNSLLIQQRLNGRDNLRIASRPQNTVYFRHFRQDLVLIPLGQTAGDQNLSHLALCFQRGSLQNVVDGLCLGRIDKAAGVDDHHVTAHNVLFDRVARFPDTVHHPFAVHLVLGTAKGYKTNICHFCYSSGKSSVSKESPFNACLMLP